MRTSALLTATSLLGAAVAIPASLPDQQDTEQHLNLRADDSPPTTAAPWVEVDDEGQPRTTHTPSFTVVDGSTSAIDGAPHDLTASVYTRTWYGEISTSTGEPPNPTATGKGDQGAFTKCSNMEGDYAPFCAPAHNSTLYTGETYYVTWDPDFYNKTAKSDNRTMEISVRLDYYNTTSGEWSKLKDLDRVPAKWGFYPFYADKKYHKGWQKGITNLTLTLMSAARNSQEKNASVALPVSLTKHLPPGDKAGGVPEGQTLYIALPTVFGSIILLVIGGCIWNRKTRRIQLGNVMSRNRGYTGRATRRLFRGGRKDSDLNLNVNPVDPMPSYRDINQERPRRLSDELGSLAGSPVDANFREQGTVGGNAFRDEISRQDQQRRQR